MREEEENTGRKTNAWMEKKPNGIQKEDRGERNKRNLAIKYRKDIENYSRERIFNRIHTKKKEWNIR